MCFGSAPAPPKVPVPLDQGEVTEPAEQVQETAERKKKKRKGRVSLRIPVPALNLG